MSEHSGLVDKRQAIIAKRLGALSALIVSLTLFAAPMVALAAEDEKTSAPAGIGLAWRTAWKFGKAMSWSAAFMALP